jgi:hypothetical protein
MPRHLVFVEGEERPDWRNPAGFIELPTEALDRRYYELALHDVEPVGAFVSTPMSADTAIAPERFKSMTLTVGEIGMTVDSQALKQFPDRFPPKSHPNVDYAIDPCRDLTRIRVRCIMADLPTLHDLFDLPQFESN